MRLKNRLHRNFFLRLYPTLFFMVVSSFVLASDHPENQVNIATASLPPYTDASGAGGGILNKIVSEAFSVVGKEVKFHDVPWERAKLYVSRGLMDAVLPISHDDIDKISDSGSGHLILKTPPLILVSRKGSKNYWNGHFDSLFNQDVVVVRGYSYMKGFDNEPKIRKIYVDSIDQQINLLIRGRVQLALMDKMTANYFFMNPAVSENLKTLSPPLQITSEFYLGFGGQRKKENVRSFKKGMEAIISNGKVQEILNEHGYYDAKENLDEKNLKKAGQYEVSSTDAFKGSGVKPKNIKNETNAMHFGIAGFYWGTDSYQRVYRKEFIESSNILGAEITEYDAEGSVDNQIRQVRELIKAKVDVIILWPTHSKKLIPVLKEARIASIPVMLTNTTIDLSGLEFIRAYTGPDNFMEGRVAARMMIEALKGKGKVVEIQGFPGYATALERSLGFEYELNKQQEENPNIKIEIIDAVSGYWSREKAKAAAERLLSRHQDFDGIYAGDDNMAIGAIEALKGHIKSKNIVITSATLFGEGYDFIKQGGIYGSVRQSPKEDARAALNAAVKIARGEEVPFYNFINLKAVTKENIESIERPGF